MRRPLVVANWKLHKTLHEAAAYVRALAPAVKDARGADIVVAPPFTALAAAVEAARDTRVRIAAQNVATERQGAFTGEVSAAMVKDAGAAFAIVGHSERRRLYGETDAIVHQKVQAALGAELIPIVCIGETLEERDGGQTLAVLDRQLKAVLDGLSGDVVSGLAIAYEPVWAIGTGRNATPAEAGDAHTHIRSRLRQWAGAQAADQCRVIYGGSVRPDNAGELTALPDVDGALVGGASLDVNSFSEIVKRAG